MTEPGTTFVALLRGINVGGNNLIRMDELEACFRALGHSEVSTYINSGNVIFRSASNDGRGHEAEIETTLEPRFSTRIRVVVRDLAQIESVLEHMRQIWNETSDEKRNVIFLTSEIDREDLLSGLEIQPELESVRYFPGVLLWSANKRHLTRSTMLKLGRMAIYQGMTVRSPNTTHRIYELMRKADAAGSR
jgi:uncharacterized protein (DUF1697 family)